MAQVSAGEGGRQDGDQHPQLGMGRAKAGGIQAAKGQAAEQGAHHHDALQGDVDDAAALGEHAAQGHQQQRDGKDDGSAEDIGYDLHASASFCTAGLAASSSLTLPMDLGLNNLAIRVRINKAKAAR